MTHEPELANLDQFFADNKKSWEDKNPEYKVVYISSAKRYEMVKEAGEKYLKAYEKIISGMYQADFWRVLVLSKFGGIYVDMDSSCMFPIDLPEASFIAWEVHPEDSHDTFSNTYMACSDSNKDMGTILDLMTEDILSKRQGEFIGLQEVGTIAYTKYIKSLRIKYKHYNWSNISIHGDEERRLATKKLSHMLEQCGKCNLSNKNFCSDRKNNPECDEACRKIFEYTKHNLYDENVIIKL